MLNPCDAAFLETLGATLPAGSLRAPEPRDLADPRGRWTGIAGAVARPRTVEEVATILRHCSAARVGVVPLGGGTGLVGGQVMPDGPLPLILSLERMQALRGVWPADNAITVEAGMTLASVQAAASDAGMLFPLSLASEGTAMIGGNLATNAGGTQVLRYGNSRELCLGIEAVLADGTMLSGLKRLRKDNTGYDLRNLLIGSEGSLGIITAASLRLFPRPARRLVALLAVPDPKAALSLLKLAETQLGGLVSGFELIARMGFDFLQETGLVTHFPFAEMPEWSVLIELGLPPAIDPEAAMAGLYAEGDAVGLILDGVIAHSEAQADHLWALRETIPEANRKIGAISSHDVSLPLGAIPDFIVAAKAALTAMAPFRINCFGHLGDGNLHFNVFPPKGESRADWRQHAPEVQRLVHDLIHERGGSISAEHGIGRFKTADLLHYGDPGRTLAMRRLKAALDPDGILNPGAVIPG